MKLSLKLVAQEITKGDVQIIRSRKNEPDLMRLDHLLLWSKAESPDLSACYVIDAAMVKADLLFPPGIALIVLGNCNPAYFSDLDADVLLWSISRREMKFTDQFNQLSLIFRYYQEMERLITDNLVNSGTLQELISFGEAMFHNMILLLDASFALLFESRKNNPLDWDNVSFLQGPSLPTETIEQILINSEYKVRSENHGLFFISNEVLNCNTLFIQIQRDQLTFYVAVLETEQTITNAHRQLLTAFAEYIFLSLRNRRFSSTKTMQFEYFLERMLINEKVEQSEINRQLQILHWKIHDRYLCCVLEENLWDKNTMDPFAICRMIDSRFPGSYSFYYNDRIICITNLTQSDLSRPVFLQMLAPYVRDQLFHVGVSFEFNDFAALVHFYHQALAAMDLGKRKHPDEWIYRFEKYALDYFTLYGISRMEPRYLCHPDLITLAQYDKENNTDLLRTLQVYLSCGQNATETATELFIHRNTLYQRLTKIESMIQGKLSNATSRLYMQISFSFMDFSST